MQILSKMPTKTSRKKPAPTSLAVVDQKSHDNMKKPGGWILHKINHLLATAFYLIWIVVGIILLIILYGNFKQGAFKGLLKTPPPPPQQAQAPTETTLPGIGKVNIDCVQKSLSSDEIQKIVQAQDYSKLTPEEKTKLDPCIVEKAEATPAATTSPKK